MAIISDNALDHELVEQKKKLEVLKIKQSTFGLTFPNMITKDRARMIREIQSQHREFSTFIERAKKETILNAGTKFSFENFKQSFQTLLSLWRKIEKKLETFVSSPGNTSGSEKSSEPDHAVEKYAEALRNMGHAPTPEMLNEFKARLESAYEKAKEQAGGKNLTINIVQEGSKIKVRMEPK